MYFKTGIFISGSDKPNRTATVWEPEATDITEILSLNNKLYSGYSSGDECCMKQKTYTYISMTDILAGKKLVKNDSRVQMK